MNKDYEIYRPFASICPWDVRDIIKVLMFYLFMVFIGSPMLYHLINAVIGNDWVKDMGENSVIILFTFFTNILVCLYVIYINCMEHKQPLIGLGLTFTNWKSDVRDGIKKYIIAFPILILAGVITDLVCKLIGSISNEQEIAKRIVEEDSTGVLVFMIVFGAFAAPVIEEFFFRGFLQTALNRYLGRWKAIVISSIFFAAVHLNMYVFLQIFILGVLLAYVFERTGSLIAPITIHVVHNSATFAFLLYFKRVSG